MSNRIKVLNMQSVYDTLSDDLQMNDEQAEQICNNITEHNDFKKVIFHHEDVTYYYFRESAEEEIKTIISNYMDINSISEYAVKDLGQDLIDTYGGSYDEIELTTHAGKITIDKDDLYTIVSDDLLNDEQYITQLVNSKDAEEFNKILYNIIETAFKELVEVTILSINQTLDKQLEELNLMD